MTSTTTLETYWESLDLNTGVVFLDKYDWLNNSLVSSLRRLGFPNDGDSWTSSQEGTICPHPNPLSLTSFLVIYTQPKGSQPNGLLVINSKDPSLNKHLLERSYCDR